MSSRGFPQQVGVGGERSPQAGRRTELHGEGYHLAGLDSVTDYSEPVHASGNSLRRLWIVAVLRAPICSSLGESVGLVSPISPTRSIEGERHEDHHRASFEFRVEGRNPSER